MAAADLGATNKSDRAALLRVAADLRNFVGSQPVPAFEDPQLVTLLEDADALERVARWIGNTVTLASR